MSTPTRTRRRVSRVAVHLLDRLSGVHTPQAGNVDTTPVIPNQTWDPSQVLGPRYEITCSTCDLTSVTTYTNPTEAELLATIHNGLHHGGHDTARVQAITVIPGSLA